MLAMDAYNMSEMLEYSVHSCGTVQPSKVQYIMSERGDGQPKPSRAMSKEFMTTHDHDIHHCLNMRYKGDVPTARNVSKAAAIIRSTQNTGHEDYTNLDTKNSPNRVKALGDITVLTLNEKNRAERTTDPALKNYHGADVKRQCKMSSDEVGEHGQTNQTPEAEHEPEQNVYDIQTPTPNGQANDRQTFTNEGELRKTDEDTLNIRDEEKPLKTDEDTLNIRDEGELLKTDEDLSLIHI